MSQKYMCVLVAMFLFAGGCASKDYSFTEAGAYDPLESVNRPIYRVNKTIDTFLLRPVAEVYDKLPRVVKDRADNFFYNLGEPSHMVNNLLQQQGEAASLSAARFVFNSTLGLGGLFDVSGMVGVKRYPADFGQTIRAYAGHDGAYLVLPLLGPSSVADAPGVVVDGLLSPLTYFDNRTVVNSAMGVNVVHVRASYLEDSKLVEETALDEYSLVRDLREEQRRRDVPENVWAR